MTKVFNYSVNEGFSYSVIGVKGEKKYFVEGYASTIDEDKAGEVLSYQAQEDMVRQIEGQNITMDLEHEEWYDSNGNLLPRPKNEKIPVAKIVSAELRPRGAWIRAELNTHLRSFHELWGSIQGGFLKAFSVAFYPIQKSGNSISKLNLVNVTLTGSPVNPNATFMASMKSAQAYLDTLKQTEEIKMDAEIKAEPKPEEVEVKAAPADTNEVSVPSVEPKAEKEDSPKDEKEDEEEKKKKEKEEADAKAFHGGLAQIKAEIMGEIAAELKSMRDKVEEKEKIIADLKAKLSEPIMKSIVTVAPTKMVAPDKTINPLSLI